MYNMNSEDYQIINKEGKGDEILELLKLVIVDDEPIILKGLVETYDWESMGFLLSGTAENGESAVELIRQIQPDLVLTDVRMKKMTGLDVIEQVRIFDKNVLFIVISAYRDFEYARKACEVGAFTYLLKPVEEERLREVMAEVKAACEKCKAERRERDNFKQLLMGDKDNFLQGMVQKYLQNRISEEKFRQILDMLNRKINKEEWFLCVCADMDISYKIINPVYYETERGCLFHYLEKLFQERYPYWIIEGENGEKAYLLKVTENRGVGAIRKLLKETAQQLESPVVSAVSGEYRGLEGMKKSYGQAIHFFETACEAGANGFTLSNEQAEEIMNPVSTTEVESLVINAIRRNDKKSLKEAFIKFVYLLPSSSREENQRRYIHKLAVSVELMLQDSYGLTKGVEQQFQNLYDTLYSLSGVKAVDICYQLFSQVIDERQNSAKSHDLTYFSEYMSNALAYIDEHISDEELSLSAVAAAIYLNPVYFGRVFKNSQNMSFKQYVLMKRMHLAKKLIVEGKESITAVGEKVGIPNRSYFTQVFKQYTGKLPSEYRKDSQE